MSTQAISLAAPAAPYLNALQQNVAADRLQAIDALFQAWRESKSSEISEALQARAKVESDATCLARLEDVLGMIVPKRELAELRLESQSWEVEYWKKRARRYEKQVRQASEHFKKDRKALEAAQKMLQKTIRSKKQAACVAIATGAGAIVLDAVTGNIPGAVIAATVMVGKAAWLQRQIYERNQSLGVIKEHLDTPLTLSDSMESLGEEEISSELSEAEWAFLRPDGLPQRIHNISQAIKEGKPIDQVAQGYGIDLLFLLEFVDSYRLPLPTQELYFQPAYRDFEESIQTANHQRITRYLRLQHIGIGGRFKPMEHLIGRAEEQQQLRSWFTQNQRQVGASVIWVSGDPGIGKSALIDDFKRFVSAKGALFASGKFDQQGQEGYGPWQSALSPFVQAILASQQAFWKERILERLGETTYILIRLLPDLEKLLGPQNPPKEEPTADAFKNQVCYAITEFINILGSQQPLFLSFDDLQWAQEDALRILKSLLSNQDCQGKVLVVGTFRTKEVGDDHPLTAVRRYLNTYEKLPQEELSVRPLTLKHLEELVKELLITDNPTPLASYLFKQTGGNPFYAHQLLKQLQQEGLIYFTNQSWQWNIEAIEQLNVPSDLKALMESRFSQLSPSTQSLLKWGSCLGHTFDADLLAAAMKMQLQLVQAQLEEAIAAGLLSPVLLPTATPEQFVRTTYYQFTHDTVQQTADLQLTYEEHRLIHFTLGDTLYLYTSDLDLPYVIGEMVSHLNIAHLGKNWHHLTSLETLLDPEEQEKLAIFNGQAAEQAYEDGDFNLAGNFAQMALLLFPNIWKKEHQLAFKLSTIRCQYFFLNQKVPDGVTLASKMLKETKNDSERLQALQLQLEGYAALAESDKSVNISINALKLLGETLPEHPGKFKILREFVKTQKIIKRFNVEAALKETLPQQQRNNRLLNLLSDTFLIGQYSSNDTFAALALLRLIQVALSDNRYQHHPESLVITAFLLVLLGDFKKARDFEKLALHLLEKNPELSVSTKARAYSRYLVWVHPWLNDFFKSSGAAKSQQTLCDQSGDFISIDYRAFAELFSSRHASLPLEISNCKLFIEHCLTSAVTYNIKIVMQSDKAAQGNTKKLTSLDDEHFQVDRDLLQKAEVNKITKSVAYAWLLLLHYTEEQFPQALELARKAWVLKVLYTGAICHLGTGIHASCLSACYRATGSLITKVSYRRELNELIKQSLVWAEGNFANFGGNYLAVLANKASILGPQKIPRSILQKYAAQLMTTVSEQRNWSADDLFAMAVKALNPHYPNPVLEGTIYLSAAAHHFEQGIGGKMSAKPYLEMAYDHYKKIEATAVVKFLENESRYKELIAELK